MNITEIINLEQRTKDFKIDIGQDVGLQMKLIATHHNLKQKDIAEAMDIAPPTLSYYFNNKRPQRVDILQKFISACKQLKKC